jgi:hypothetical protein
MGRPRPQNVALICGKRIPWTNVQSILQHELDVRSFTHVHSIELKTEKYHTPSHWPILSGYKKSFHVFRGLLKHLPLDRHLKYFQNLMRAYYL